MASVVEEIGAIRREIWSLLKLQMETLGSSQQLTDRQIIECYNRQIRVLELREKLEMRIPEKRAEVAEVLSAENSFQTSIQRESFDSYLNAA